MNCLSIQETASLRNPRENEGTRESKLKTQLLGDVDVAVGEKGSKERVAQREERRNGKQVLTIAKKKLKRKVKNREATARHRARTKV